MGRRFCAAVWLGVRGFSRPAANRQGVRILVWKVGGVRQPDLGNCEGDGRQWVTIGLFCPKGYTTGRLAMTIERKVLEKLRDLPPDKQKAVLDFVESLNKEEGKKGALRSVEGLWADLDIQITEEDIAEARREMWGNFPRDIEL